MNLLRHGFLRILIIAAVLILAALIALNIFIDRKLAREAPVYLERFSEETGYKLELNEIGLDPLFNLRLAGLSVTDPSLQGAQVAEINTIIVVPGIISSILEKRIVINQVRLDKPRVWATKDNIQKLLRVTDEREKEEKEEPSRFAVKYLKLRDSVFHISPDLGLSSEALDIGIEGNSGKESSEVNLSGDLNVMGSRLDIKGTVNSGKDLTSGVLDIVTEDLSSIDLKLLDNGGRRIGARSRLNFEYSDKLEGHGSISIGPGDLRNTPDVSALGVEYVFNYDPLVKTATLERLDMKMNGLLEGGFTGSADFGEDNLVYNIQGDASVKDLSVLKNLVPGLSQDEIEGSASLRDFVVSGSVQKKDLSVKGGVFINGLSFKKAGDGPGLNGLDCELNINQNLPLGGSTPSISAGTCKAVNFDWVKTGKMKDITTEIKITAAENLSGTNIMLSNLKGSYMEGELTGSIGFDFSNGGLKPGGTLTGKNLNLAQTPGSLIPVDITGTAETLTAKFSGGSGSFDADITFQTRDLVLSLSEGKEFRLSGLSTLENLEFKYVSRKEGVEPLDDAGQTISLRNKGLRYENLNYGDYLVKSGQVKEVSFSLNLGREWTLGLASSGSGFEVLGKDISLARFDERLQIEKSGREGFAGHVKGEGGKFKAIEFPSLEWDYEYQSGFIQLSALKADIGTIGRFETDDLSLRMGDTGGYPFVSVFKDSKFTGLDQKVSSDTLSGEFTINDPGSDLIGWEGSIEAQTLEVLSQPVTELRVEVMPAETGLVLNNITGQFLGGALGGKIDVDTRGPRARIVSDIELSGASLPSDDMTVNITRADFDFSGLLPESSLPEGSGKLEFQDVMVTKNGRSYTYRGGISGTTQGETLFIEEGFIVGEDSSELRFKGKMADSLNENRKLELSMPGVSIPVAMNVLRPFLPESLAQAKTEGQVDLELIFYDLFYPSQRLGGKLGILRGSYIGTLSGTELSAKEIYGAITIRDDTQSANPLSTFVRDNLKLSKSIYQKFLRSIKDFDTSQDSDYLKIGELRYGIIKIENIDCQLEVDREKLNLKKLTSKMYRGGLYGAAVYSFQEPNQYNISFLFDEISMEAISESISTSKDYITGRVNGLAWITGEGGDLNTIGGPFRFWAIKSSKEQRKVGEALLDRLGAKERLILGSSRGYDYGEISGYINDGVITFKIFNISNSILGYKNLSIQADPRQNTISINHLISVIRELAKRSQYGGPKVETN